MHNALQSRVELYKKQKSVPRTHVNCTVVHVLTNIPVIPFKDFGKKNKIKKAYGSYEVTGVKKKKQKKNKKKC